MNNLKLFIKKEPELAGSFFIAVLSCFFIPPSAKYIGYIDFDVLIMLFCLMLVISALTKNNVFAFISRYFVNKAHNARELSFILIYASFFSAMLVTNDVALIIFVPLASVILGNAGLHGYILFVTVMQTVAANLGSMLTPIGNPQNLFLYSYFKLTFADFLMITLPVVCVSFLLIIPTILWISKKHIRHAVPEKQTTTNKNKTTIFALLFLLCLVSLFHFISYTHLFLIVCLVTILTDKSLFKLVDYKLLFTFVFFFIFCGNLTSLQVVKDALIPYILGNELFISIATSQFISNVPAALVLAGFTDNYRGLILGTNIGGLGTLIASMASLISFRYYKRTPKAKPFAYIYIFSIVNILFLIVLTIFVKYTYPII